MTSGSSLDSKRFHVRRRIGSGAFGVVYEAFDTVREQVVAIKVLRNATPEALYRFKREFRSLTGIVHRNLVRLYELIAEDDQWLVSMELIRGTTFIEHVRRETVEHWSGTLPPMRADIGRLRVALAQLASGVMGLHNAGKLHRDLKPSNVLVADDRRVVVLDFGLVMDTDLRASEESTSTSGTPVYMSPEQGGGEPLGPPSDWYSVGIMLYDTLTGQVPFHGSYVDVINEKRSADVPPPSTIASGIPEDIDALCRDLLRRDPRERPTGEEILQRLRPSKVQLDSAKLVTSAPLVGRDRHLRDLRDAFDATLNGAQTTICVHGVSGVGKTALIRTFLERLRNDVADLLVLSGRCYQRESMPFKGVDSLIDALHRYLSRLQPHELDALLPRDIAAAEQLFPILGDVGDIVRSLRRGITTTVPDESELRRRAFAAMRELFLRLADHQALILVIDDLQWADAESAEFIESILRPPDAPPLLFIASYRSDDWNGAAFVRALRAEMPVRDIDVAELTPDESRQLAASVAGSDEVANTIAGESRGNPSLIVALARSFALADDAVKSSGGDPDALLQQALQARLRRLDRGAALMLEYIAVNKRPMLLQALRLVFRREDFDDTRSALLAQHLIRTRDTPDGEALEPYHDRIARAAIALLSEDELRDMHAVLGLALESLSAVPRDLVVEHFRAAGMHDRAAKYASGPKAESPPA